MVYEAFFTVAIMLVRLRRLTQAHDARRAELAEWPCWEYSGVRGAQAPRA